MKILQINVVYPTGSTGKIVKDIHMQLIADGYDSVVCYGRGPRISDPFVYKTAPELVMMMQSAWSKLSGYAYAGCWFSTVMLTKIIKREKPDVVHIHCINGYMVNIYSLLKYLKVNAIHTVLTLHAEFMHTAGCGYAFDCEKWKTGCGKCPQKGNGRPSSKLFDRSHREWVMMKNAFSGFDNLCIVSVSDWLHNRAKLSPFFSNAKLSVIFNGVDTKNVFKPTDTTSLRTKLKFVDERIILHVTPNFNSPIKGGRYVIQIAERLASDNIKVVVVGFNGDPSKLPRNVIAISHTDNQVELAEYYSMADITLLTSKKETYSMICAESLSCGTPVVGFKAGAPETISLPEYSMFVEYGDVNALEKATRSFIGMKEPGNVQISITAAKSYSKESMYKQYRKIYDGCVKC
ncbi:MAG: glycosyltransferase [Armatimonadota bacterium]